MKNRKKWIFIVPAAILGMTLFVGLGGWLVMFLWNLVLPPLFGWRLITFWQALALLGLCRILFGSWGMHGPQRSGFRKRMHERWEGMTPEEREKFREAMRKRWGECRTEYDAPTQETP